MSYATPAQLLKRYDARIVGDLVSDNGITVKPPELITNANLLAVLEDASGEVDAAVLQAKRYTTAQLAALTGNSAAYLVRITCAIAMGLLWERREISDDEDDGQRESAQKRARQALTDLRKGVTIFDVEDVKDAGLPAIETPSVTQISTLNLSVDQARGHFYPRRTYHR